MQLDDDFAELLMAGANVVVMLANNIDGRCIEESVKIRHAANRLLTILNKLER